jgi:hypothetical protein
MVVVVEAKEVLLVPTVLRELVVILILLKIVVVALGVQVDILKVVVGVAVDVIEGKYVTGGVTAGGKQVVGLTIEPVREHIQCLVELVELEVQEDLGEGITTLQVH